MTVTKTDRLHLGCGLTVPDGWLNVDGSWSVVLARQPWLKKLLVATGLFSAKAAKTPWSPKVVRLNLMRPLPFVNDSFIAVYSSHTLEHLYHSDALALLKECLRVLKPGGVCRMVVPDLQSMNDRYFHARQAGDRKAGTRFMEEMLAHDKHRRNGLLGTVQRLRAFDRHKWMYDAESLADLFEEAGFQEVTNPPALEGRMPGLREVEDPARIENGSGVVAEGIKKQTVVSPG